MVSIRSYAGMIYLCGSCGQPCYLGSTEYGPAMEHFPEQWDGIICPAFPLAENPIQIEWNPDSLRDLKAKYPDTFPH